MTTFIRLGLVLAGLGLPTIAAAQSPGATDWPTGGYNAARISTNNADTTIGAANAATLKPAWTVSVDGSAITAQAIVATGIATASGSRDLVFVGTEHGTNAALDAATGTKVWSVNTGFNHVRCKDLPNGDFGITAAAAFDRSSGTLYAMGGDGKLYAYAAGTGAVRPGWPVTVVADPAVEHVYGALNVVNGGVYVIIASMCDQGTYHGRIVRVATTQPSITNWLYIDGTVTDANGNITRAGPGGGGVWGSAGVSVDPTGYVYTATGNVFTNPENQFYGNHILKMLPDLSVVSQASPPSGCSTCDHDFTATPVVYQPAGCKPELAVLKKDRHVYVYQSAPFGVHPLQSLFNDALVGDVAYDPVTQTLISANLNGINAYTVGKSCLAQPKWAEPGSSAPGGGTGFAVSPPTIANGVVFYVNGEAATLQAFDLGTGRRLWAATLGALAFAQPTVAGGALIVSAWDGKVYAFRP